jgi:hypothetical protein
MKTPVSMVKEVTNTPKKGTGDRKIRFLAGFPGTKRKLFVGN